MILSLGLGEERTRDELVPMLTEMIDKIDDKAELLLALAEQLGRLVIQTIILMLINY